MTEYPKQVRLVEVGARDGLQNERVVVPSHVKIELINRLADSGLSVVEATSAVSPKWIPQLADAEAVYGGINKRSDTRYPVLVPNEKGLERALQMGVTDVAIFAAASETFSRKNINCSIADSIARFRPVVEQAKFHRLWVRGYVSCVLGCPYEGPVAATKVAEVAEQLYALGCDEISLGDTIGVGTPIKARQMVETVAESIPLQKLAIHFHDTYGQALANILACLELGIATIDTSVAGLGGCPYASGASGNVATEDVVYMLEGMDIKTGVDLDRLIETGEFICKALQRQPASKLAQVPSHRRHPL